MPGLPRFPLIQHFLNGLEHPFVLARLFEDLPEIECFVKDTHGRRLHVSSGIWKRLGFSSGADMVGKTDGDLFPRHIADQYRRSDERVLESGLPLVGLLEVWITAQGVFDWFVVNIYPVQGRDGRPIGIMGVSRAAGLSERPYKGVPGADGHDAQGLPVAARERQPRSGLNGRRPGYSTVTLLARFRGLSTSQPSSTAV
jgi:hypothetical protein